MAFGEAGFLTKCDNSGSGKAETNRLNTQAIHIFITWFGSQDSCKHTTGAISRYREEGWDNSFKCLCDTHGTAAHVGAVKGDKEPL